MAYAQRLERDADVGVREAFKVLHQGLSCLAGQINATDSHSAHVAAQLTNNWEQLARRLTEIRLDIDESHRVLDARLSAAEKASDYSSSALDHALEKIEAFARQRTVDQAESQRQTSRHEQALERLSDAFLKMEKRLPDSDTSHRLDLVEQAMAHLNAQKKPDNAPLLSALQALSHRMDALEKDHGDLLMELRARLFDPAPRPDIAPVCETIEQPPVVEPPVLEPAEDEPAVVPDFEDLFSQDEPAPVNFLTRARMAAAVVPDVPKPRYVLPAAIVLGAVLAIAVGLTLRRPVEHHVAAKPVSAGPTYSVPLPPSTEDTQFAVAPEPGGESDFATQRSEPAAGDSVPHPSATPRARDTHNVPVRPASDTAKPAQAASAPPVDRVQQLAGQGNVQALTVLGLRAVDGAAGVAVNLPDAVKYLTQAAEKGQPVAQYRLGTLYERGQGVAADPAKASHWYEFSADQGNRKAMHNLAVFYASRKDMANAARWFAKAASLGLSDSQFNLAVLYERGDGVPQSLVEAFKWYSIAAAAGDVESKARVTVLQTQLNDVDKATAAKEIEAFHPLAFDHAANVPPEADQLPPA